MISVADPSSRNALSVRSVSVALGRTQALSDVSLSLQSGWTAIVGPNGAG